MGMSVKFRFLIFLLVCTYLLSIYNYFFTFLLLLIPILFREEFTLLVARLLINSKITPPIAFKQNYVFDVKSKVLHVFYKVEPLYDIARLTSNQYVGLVQDLMRRLRLDDNSYVTFIVKGNDKYVRVSRKIQVLEDLEKYKSWFKNVEDVLRGVFILHRLEGDELKKLIDFKAIKIGKTFTKLLPILIIHFFLFKIYGLTAILIPIIMVLWRFKRLDVVISTRLTYNHYSSKFTALFSTFTDDDVKSMATSTLRTLNDYAITISANNVLPQLASKLYHKYHEKMVVQERGFAYARLQQWKHVIDRINQGELPLRVVILTNDKFDLPYTSLSSTLPVNYVFWNPELAYQHALSRDVCIFFPLIGGRLEFIESRAKVELGKDEVGKSVILDFDALPSSHGLIVGPTGMGKSWTIQTIVYKLLKSGIKFIIIDPHGEYLKIPGVESIDVTKYFINIFDLNGLTVEERISRIVNSLIFAFNIPPHLYDVLHSDFKIIYESMSSKVLDFHVMFNELIKVTEVEYLRSIYERVYSFFKDVNIISVSRLLENKALIFKGLIASPEVTRFTMLQLIDHIYSHVLNQKERKEKIEHVLVVDEAYYILQSPMIELYVRGLRKFSLGTIMITQTLSGISHDVLQNLGFIIILGGSEPYVSDISQSYKLSDEDFKWLITALAPHMYGKPISKAILVTGPIKRHVEIELLPELKK